MKKILVGIFALVMSLGVFAGDNFQAYIGAGQTAIANSGNAIVYSSKFETSINAGFRYFPIERFAIDAQFFHDTAKVGRWLNEHHFISALPIDKYEYTTLGVYAEYWPVRNSAGGLFVFAGPQEFFATGKRGDRLGLAAGVGGQYTLIKKLFVESKAEYWHVQNFMGFDVVNTYNVSFSVGLKF